MKTINPHDTKVVANHIFKTLDLKEDLVFSQGPLDALDHSSATDHYGYRLGVDATRKFEVEGNDVEWNSQDKDFIFIS